jgi:hypothetical protein
MFFKRFTNALLLFLLAIFFMVANQPATEFVTLLVYVILFSIVGIFIVNYIVLNKLVIFHLNTKNTIENELIKVPNFLRKILYLYLGLIIVFLLYFLVSPTKNCIRSGMNEKFCINKNSW